VKVIEGKLREKQRDSKEEKEGRVTSAMERKDL
jgi:hypothetical protein